MLWTSTFQPSDAFGGSGSPSEDSSRLPFELELAPLNRRVRYVPIELELLGVVVAGFSAAFQLFSTSDNLTAQSVELSSNVGSGSEMGTMLLGLWQLSEVLLERIALLGRRPRKRPPYSTDEIADPTCDGII
jgi:hypothetical protein